MLYLAKAVERMVVDALVAADAVLKLSQKIDDPDKYLHLTDSILETIENSHGPVSLTYHSPPP